MYLDSCPFFFSSESFFHCSGWFFPHHPTCKNRFLLFVLKCWFLHFYFFNIVCFILSGKLKWFNVSFLVFNVYILSLCGSVNLGLHFHILCFPWIDTLFMRSWSNAHKSNISHILHGIHKNVKLRGFVSYSCHYITCSRDKPGVAGCFRFFVWDKAPAEFCFGCSHDLTKTPILP
jgi:hypothetical protein